MTLRITIDLFSGRRNPTIELKGREAKEALDRLKPAGQLTKADLARIPPSTLGYRGLIIEQVGAVMRAFPKSFRLIHGDLVGPRLARRAEDGEYEQFLFGSKGPASKLRLGDRFLRFLRAEIARSKEVRTSYTWKKNKWNERQRCECAPLYEPGWWNDAGQKQSNNNCYNYATNYRTDTFAQPGLAAGAEYTALTCASVRPAAQADDLIDDSSANNKCPKEGHLVALVIAPGFDFHWYRKGRNGYWTHKPGGTPATNVDNSGLHIPDPRTADRGPYTSFCTFMVVMHGHIKIE
jgi:hypothetical protein